MIGAIASAGRFAPTPVSPVVTPDPESPDLPVDSFREAAAYLRRPFTAAAVKHKVQASWSRSDSHQALIVSYIDARLVIERLNLVCPHLWTDRYDPIPRDGNSEPRMWCHLTIDGITRSDVGEGRGKGLVSDALKRAAVRFGVGVSLYAIPKIILDTGRGELKLRPNRQGEAKVEITEKGTARCRELYQAWLDVQGIQAYGDPFDHGDDIGAAGDVEVDEGVVPSDEAETPASGPQDAPAATETQASQTADTEPAPEEEPKRIDPIEAAALYDAAMAVDGVTPTRLRQAVSYVLQADSGDLTNRAEAIEAMTRLTPHGAKRVTKWINTATKKTSNRADGPATESETS